MCRPFLRWPLLALGPNARPLVHLRLCRPAGNNRKPASWTVFERAWIIQVMEAPASGDYPSLPELRTRLIPRDNESQCDWGEPPRAGLTPPSRHAPPACRL